MTRFDISALTEQYCFGCVLYPPNLPPYAYAEADWAVLQYMTCSLEHSPGTEECKASRKTSCSLVELAPSPCHCATPTLPYSPEN